MNINSVKANLRNIVLLTKEYREKVTASDLQTLEHVQETDKANPELVKEVYGTAQTTLRQIDFFAKKILNEFALQNKKEFEIDYKHAKQARRRLSPDELHLLKYLYDMQTNHHYLGIDESGKYKQVKVEEIVPSLNEFTEKVSLLKP